MLLAPHELLVVGSGTDAGVRLGQQFFIRHAPFLDVSGYGRPRGPMSAGAGRATVSRRGAAGRPYASAAFSSTTAGWLRIVSVNQTTAIARVEYACDAIFQGDYLEPFGAPEVPAGTDRDDFTVYSVASGPSLVLYLVIALALPLFSAGLAPRVAPGWRLAGRGPGSGQISARPPTPPPTSALPRI